MFEVRADEPDYAVLRDGQSRSHNVYGSPIETVPADSTLRGMSLNINGDRAVGDNPNRYKQHGFFFNADNCIGCHACEAACSEKNDNPGHIAFRSVGFVEGGCYPDYRRINISMACNHCDNPVCLKGCPTRAYTKFAEYGAVLQDPDICFGCGYCTWVCPYNAPQLDPVKGQVSKCNMCVDRLEVGLKPACVSACLGNALDFGVIENIPERRTQARTDIPGFPRTDITRPNIRFQQTLATPREMARTDSTAVKYHRDDRRDRFVSVLDRKHGEQRRWNLRRLFASHENAHAVFTLSTQAVMGAFVLLTAGTWAGLPLQGLKSSAGFVPLLAVMVVLMSFGLYRLTMHLGKPHRFYRGFNNLRLSPVSREIAGVSLFFAGLLGYGCLAPFDAAPARFAAGLAAGVGLAGVAAGSWYMYRLYRIPARPFWNHWQTATAFYGSLLSLGGLLSGLFAFAFAPEAVPALAAILAAGLLLEAIGLMFHARYLKSGEGEAASAHYEQTTAYGKTYRLRNALLGVNLVLACVLANAGVSSGHLGMAVAATLAATLPLSAYLGRILFYVLVIPTTMPGAFFWRNKGFVEHARATGLADMPQLGVVYERHHRFDVSELIKTVRMTRPRALLAHVRWILTGAAAPERAE